MKKGFSLVELLVVIAIIMLLIAFLMPVFTFVVEHAKYVQCQSNMRNLHGGFMAYASDNRGALPFYVAGRYTMTTVAMHWSFPAMRYLIEMPDTNPYSGAPWRVPGDKGDFAKYLKREYPWARDMLFCQGGDNNYYHGAYEGKRTYLSNYVGYLGPCDHCHAIGRNRDYQNEDPTKYNRPIMVGTDLRSTWLLTDYHWSAKREKRYKVVTGHKDYSKNILYLDGSIFFAKPEFWQGGFDKFPD